jgi:uncharacterized protein (DUF1501 family)
MTQPIPSFQTRREFLRTSLVGGALSWTVPSFLHATMQTLFAAADGARTQTLTGKDGPILVVVQLAGGNDGLNTVVPIGNDFYYRARPQLGIPARDALKLTDQAGLHPALTGLKALYDAGHLAVVQGVGYPNPNRSHFRSMEIWQTASDANRFEAQGWIGRYFDCCCPGQDAVVGISVGQETPQAFNARIPKGISFNNLRQYQLQGPARWQQELLSEEEQLYRQMSSERAGLMGTDSGGSIGMLVSGQRPRVHQAPIDFLERTHLDAEVSSEQIHRILGNRAGRANYPASPLGNDLAMVGRLIGGGMSTRIYYVSQGGYDTHTQQAGTHQRLLGEFSAALQAFIDELKVQGNLERVQVLVFSEFGRRVNENGSAGTDHGAAAPIFLAGGRIKAGLHGKMPSLNPKDLDQGDVKHHVDFRSVYATVLEKHLRVPGAQVLGRAFPTLSFT